MDTTKDVKELTEKELLEVIVKQGEKMIKLQGDIWWVIFILLCIIIGVLFAIV